MAEHIIQNASSPGCNDLVCMWMCNGRYVRYMDNCVMWVKTKEEAHKLLNFLRWYLQISRKLEIEND